MSQPPTPTDVPRRRGDARVAAVFKVRYESLDDLVVAYTEDVSRGGVYLRSETFLPVGAVVRIKLSLPKGAGEVEAIARVAYVLDAKKAAERGKRPGMGMQFLDVGGRPVAEQIAEHLELQARAELELPPAQQAARILVVDDNEAYRKQAEAAMRAAGHHVISAENGVQALGRALQTPPDLVLSDVQMPAMDGWQLVRVLRSRPSLANLAVIFVTTLSGDEERLLGYRMGVDDYIPKPYDPEELTIRVQRVLDRARAYPRSLNEGKVLRGDLSQVALPSLLSFLEMERRTGLLLLVRDDAVASIYLNQGHVVRVLLPNAADERPALERLFEVLDWNSGRFELAEAEVHEEDEVGMPTSHALMEHARRKDEAGRG
ncbi:MAG: response regulator [Myxococcales bacterium]|nr:response regulator [Myxococcales bacterium]